MNKKILQFNKRIEEKTNPYTLSVIEERKLIDFFFYVCNRNLEKEIFNKKNFFLLKKISNEYYCPKFKQQTKSEFEKIIKELTADFSAVVPSDGATSRNSAAGAAEETKLLENKANQANKRRRLLHYNLGVELILTVWLILIPIYIFIDRGFSKDFIFDMITPMFYWLCGFIVLPILVSVKNEFQTFFTEKELKK